MLKSITMMVVLVSVVGCSSKPEQIMTYSKPVCSPEKPPAVLPFISDETLMLMGKEARDDVYEIVDSLTQWGNTNQKIVEELCL